MIAQSLHLAGWDDQKKDILPAVHAWLSDENNGRWTMIVDNADNPDVMSGSRDREDASQTNQNLARGTRSLAAYLPSSGNGSIVITSRSREVVEGLLEYDEDILHVETMTVDEGAALLSKKLRPENRTAQRDDLIRVVRELDCMPLAITQAAAYINQRAPRMSVSKYLENFLKSDVDSTTLLEQDLRDPRRDEKASNSIITTGHISFEHIRQTRNSAARLLALMCLFDRESIPQDLLVGRYLVSESTSQVDKPDQSQLLHDFENDIATLRAYSLVRVGSNNHIFDMHRLVQFSTRRWLELHGELAQWQTQYAALLCGATPTGEYANWAVCRALLPHMETLMSYNVDNESFRRDWATVAYRGSWYMWQMGKYVAAERLARSCLAQRKQMYDAESIEMLESVSILALALRYQGKYKEAEELHRQALDGYTKVLTLEHPYTLTSMSNLAFTLVDQGRYKQAEQLHRQVLAGRETLLEADHPDTLASIDNIASALSYQGQYKQAEQLHRQVVEGRVKKLGPNHPNTMTSMDNLASTLRYQGQYKQAEALHRQVLAGRQKELGFSHPHTLMSVEHLASVLRVSGLHSQAEQLYRQALEGYTKEFPPNHPSTLTTMGGLALTLRYLGKYEEAEQIYLKVLPGSEAALGSDHPSTLMNVHNLALIYQDQRRYDKAEKLHHRALRGKQKELGDGHPETFRSVWCLACLAEAQGKFDEAEKLYSQAVAGFMETLGPAHPDTLECVSHREQFLEVMREKREKAEPGSATESWH